MVYHKTSGGFFLLPRGWQDNPAWRDEPFSRAQAWAWLVEEARWKPARVNIAGKTVELQRGELSYSIRFLAVRWGWGKGVVERFIGRLKTETLIETRSETGRLIITIRNYNEMQSTSDKGGAETETLIETSPGHRRDTAGTNKNQSNKSNKGKKGLVAVVDDAAEAVGAWNEMAGRHGLAQVSRLTEARHQKLRHRLSEAGGLDGWRHALGKLAAAKWMHGENDRGWKADFDFMLQQKSFTRLVEGGYDRVTPPATDNGVFTLIEQGWLCRN